VEKESGVKVIFLDFDGVLCNHESMSAGYKARTAPEQDPYGPHADCVAALNRIIEETGAFIVVSSTWRKCKNPNARMRETLKRWGVRGDMIGTTPVLYGDQYSYVRRGSEVQQWLDTVRTPVESFVILDDDEDMAHLRHRLVRTSSADGLTQDDADRAIAILNAPPTDLLLDRMFQERKA
jgi:hypothetical protein